MATATEPDLLLFADPTLLRAVVGAVDKAMSMCGLQVKCVGASSVPLRESGQITGLIGVHGKVSGFMTVNMGERFAIRAVEGLLQDHYDKLTHQVVDGVGEITNLIVGGIKGAMASSPRQFSHITVPSVIVGTGYQIAYAQGLELFCAMFEHEDQETLMLEDRLLQVNISLLRL
jgi:chemotaxis protein CheX